MDFIDAHPYLIANLLSFFLVVAAIRLARPESYRRLLLQSGLACLPCSFLALLHNETYWTPNRWGDWPLGVEDFLFAFTIGSLAWMSASWPYRFRLSSRSSFSRWLIRSLLAGLLFGGVSLLLAAVGIGGLENTLVAGAVMVVFFLLQRPVFWPLAFFGGLLFLPVYVGIVKIQFYFWPEYVGQWSLGGVLGAMVLGVPLGEIVFAAVFALLWPLHIAFAYDVQIEPPRRLHGDRDSLPVEE